MMIIKLIIIIIITIIRKNTEQVDKSNAKGQIQYTKLVSLNSFLSVKISRDIPRDWEGCVPCAQSYKMAHYGKTINGAAMHPSHET